MKKLWKKGLPALVLLVFGVVSAGCDNGTTSTGDGDSVAVTAQKFANELDRLFEGSGYAESIKEEGVVEVRGAPRFDVRLDMRTPNVTKELSIPAGVTLRLGDNGADTVAGTGDNRSSPFVFQSRATLEDNVGKATLVIKGQGTLELTGEANGALRILSDDNVQDSSQLIIESGVTVKFSSTAQVNAISNNDTTGALPADQITWKPGSKIGAGRVLATEDIPGLPTQDDSLALDFIADAALTLDAGDKIGALTINKNGTIAIGTALIAGQSIVTGKVTVKGTNNDNGGTFAPESAAGNFIVDGDIVVNNSGKFNPADQISMKKVYLNDKAASIIPANETFKFTELYIAKDATLTVTASTVSTTPTLAVVGVKLDNKGKITVKQGAAADRVTTLKLTVDERNKQEHINEGTITVDGKAAATGGIVTLALTGGVTLQNKGTIKFATGASVVAGALKGVIQIADDSTLINNKVIDLVDVLGSIVFAPGADLYPTLTFKPGSELRGVRVAKTLASTGNNLAGATLWNCNNNTPAVAQVNLEFDEFQDAFDAYVGVSPYGTAANQADLGPATTAAPGSTNDPGYLKFKKEWDFISESAATIGVNTPTTATATDNVELVLEYDES